MCLGSSGLLVHVLLCAGASPAVPRCIHSSMASYTLISTLRMPLLVALALTFVLQRASGQGSDLLFVSTPASWSAAEADCVKRGGHLASISTATDNERVQELCAQNLPNAQLQPKVSSTSPGCWIGLNDHVSESNYAWSDGTTYSYTGWRKGADLPQPDDEPKQTQWDEDCTLFVVANGYVGWHDWGCDDQQAYVCKVPVGWSPSGSATSLTGSVASGGMKDNTGTPDSLATGVNSSSSNSNTAASRALVTDGNETWRLVVSIVVPVLTGLAALITIAYTGWKWWHKRQATLARRRADLVFGPPSASGSSTGSNVKPLIAVDV